MSKRVVSLMLAALALHAAPAWAVENWIIYNDETGTWGYDAESLKRDPQTGLITANSVTYNPDPTEFEKGVTFHYLMAELVYDCGMRMTRYNDAVYLDNDAKAVKTLVAGDNPKWNSVDDKEMTDFITWHLFEVGCEGKPSKTGGIPAGDMKSALAKMKAAN